MKKYLQIGLTLLFILIVATACHDESEEVIKSSTLELVKSGKKKPKMVYSTGEKGRRATAESDKEEKQENLENIQITFEVDGADLHLHFEGFMENGYLLVQDNIFQAVFTKNVALIDNNHSLDIYLPEAEDYPYRITLESDKYYVQINIWLE